MVESKTLKQTEQQHQYKKPSLSSKKTVSHPLYEKILLHKIQTAYPSPILDKNKDENLENLVKHSLNEILKLKHKDVIHSSFLGKAERVLNTEEDIVKVRKQAELPLYSKTPNEVISKVSGYFNGVLDNASPIMLENVTPPSNIPAIISTLFSSLYNIGVVQDEFCWNIALTEIEMIGMMAKLCGFDPEIANGTFTFGGTGNELYALKVALTRVLGIESRKKGIRDTDKVKVFVSEIGHYCKFNDADWLGIGMDNMVMVDINKDNSMNVDNLYEKLKQSAESGEKIVAISKLKMFWTILKTPSLYHWKY